MKIKKLSRGQVINCLLQLFLVSLFINTGYSQNKTDDSKKLILDYKVINSNESFIELEFYPEYKSNSDFTNALSNTTRYGIPDVKFRSFPIFFPGNFSNRIEIIDSKFTDIPNVEIAPVPSIKKSKDKDAVVPVYNKDEKIYSENRYFPGDAAALSDIGALRNKYLGYLNIYPVLYNPVTISVRKYSYLRVRVKFGSSPLYNNKVLSREERSFIDDIGINSNAAFNWSTKEFNDIRDLPVQNSVLATGDFFKIEIKESGIYRIDKNFLQSAGINTGSIDPRTIKIYGNGGAMLPYKNSTVAPNDLVENRIFVSGQEDGQFNDADFLLFYARSPNEWNYDTIRRTYTHKLNTFSKINYYWITYGGVNGQRMNEVNSGNLPGITPLTSFKERIFDESEVNNLGSTGLLWVSQRISVNQNFTFNKDLTGYVDGSNVNFRFRFGNGSSFPEWWRVEDPNSSNPSYLQTVYVPPLTSGFSHINLNNLGDNPYGVNYPLTPGKKSINFKASLRSQDGNSPNVAGYYDYYEVHYDRYLTADNNMLRFDSPDTNATVEYQINNFTSSDARLFEVSQFENVSIINPVSFSNGVLRFQSAIVNNSPKEFYAIGGNNYKTPVSISSKIANQNLKGDLSSGATFIIISPKEFLSAANRLKAHRERPGNNYLKTVVVEIEKIYNEFSGGLQDPVAMRNYIKYANSNWDERPVYILFFGDGSYDYKNIYNLYNSGLKNWIPPIEKNSQTSDEVESYCTDDFIVEINEDNNEPVGFAITDFCSGRLPVNTIDEANIVVDKIISYEDPLNYDKWRNEGTYVADDGWTTDATGGQERSVHTDQCEEVAQIHSPDFLKKNKIYIVSYPSEITPQGRRKPGAYADVIKHWNEGRLVINYTGHGSTDLWAHEHVFEKQTSIPQLTNKNKYPFVTIASCDLARWDDPFNICAAELLVTIKDKGAIGVMAAVRAVYADQNAVFNNEFYDNLFKVDSLNLRLRFGKTMFNVKQQRYFDNDLKFALIGDPTVRLGVPQYTTRIDSINGTPGSMIFDMKSLQKVKISGSILRADSTFWQDYSGSLDLKVLDVDKNIALTDFGFPFNYRLLGGLIFTGRTNVVNGIWNMEFIVPKDISFNPGRGKIIAYFKNNESDGLGFSDKFIMAGRDSTAQPDSTGPVVNIFLGNRSFRTGDMVNQNPKLLADFTDENGINLTGTIGHRIEGILNEDENNKIDLTPFYVSNSGYQNGTVEYQMQNLQDGKYRLEVKAWDTYNNYNSSTIEFDVKGSSELALDNIYNYPNPMQDFTNFVFQHNFDEPLTADVKIYTVSGRLIKELNKINITDKFVSLQWDGRDNDGDAIANGTYIYKIFIKSEDGAFSKSTTGKLAKLK